MSAVSVGDVINGKYLVEAVIGEGGVGVVVRAQNLELDERVALKFLRPEMLAHKEIVARFAREAKAASSIKSEYVATVFDVGTMANGTPFLVMEHLEGKDLSTVLHERGRLGPREAAEYAMQVCEALAVAHAKGVIDRDIKPDNLFVTTRSGMNILKVLDFGISKTALTGSMFGDDLPIVKTVSLMGTPLYMSPEQVRSAQAVDERADIWALGMVLYEALAGRSPFKATSITELCAEILERPIASITTYRTDLPPALVHVLERCIEKDPDKRYPNVAELAMALMPFAPRRARLCAERAAQALMAAGIIEQSTITLTSTYPPPAVPSEPGIGTTSPSFDLSASGEFPRSSSTPAIASAPSLLVAPPSASSTSMPVAASSSGSISAVQMPPSLTASLVSASPPRGNAKVVVAVVAVAAIAAAAAVFAWVHASSSGGPVAAAQASPSPSPSPPPQAQSLPPPSTAPSGTTPVDATSAKVETAGASARAPAQVPPQAKASGPTWRWSPKPATPPPPNARGAAAPGAPGPATAPKKSNEDPDLGY